MCLPVSAVMTAERLAVALVENNQHSRLQGTILPGVTRGAVIELARQRGYTVEETDVPITQAMEVRESELATFQHVILGVQGVTLASTLLRSSGALAEACWLQHCTLLHLPLECTCGNNTHLLIIGCCGAGWAERRCFWQQPQNPAKREICAPCLAGR